MIELRYVMREGLEVSKNLLMTEKVLQYREMENLQEIGIQEPIWSEWIDVPEE